MKRIKSSYIHHSGSRDRDRVLYRESNYSLKAEVSIMVLQLSESDDDDITSNNHRDRHLSKSEPGPSTSSRKKEVSIMDLQLSEESDDTTSNNPTGGYLSEPEPGPSSPIRKKKKAKRRGTCREMESYSERSLASASTHTQDLMDRDLSLSESEPGPSSPKRKKEKAKRRGSEGESHGERSSASASTHTEHEESITFGTEHMPNKGLETKQEELKEYKTAALVYHAGKKNTIWQDVVEEERMKDMLEQMTSVSMARRVDKFVIRRGVESYVVGNKRKRKTPEEIRAQADKAAAVESETMEAGDVSDSSISSGCFTDSTLEQIKAMNKQKKAKAAGNLKVREKGKKTGEAILRERFANTTDKDLPFTMGKLLYEPKKHLLVRTMQVFGRDFLIKTFFKTLKIDRLGGVYTRNKERRRTPGGVFLHMVRNDKSLSQADRDAVFEHHFKEALEEKRKNKAFQKNLMFESMRLQLEAAQNCDTDDKGEQNQLKEMDLEAKVSMEIEKEDEIQRSYPVSASTSMMPSEMLARDTRPILIYDDL